MTFQETEYPALITSLLNMIKDIDNPIFFQAVLKELWKEHSLIPLYPGIVGMCLSNIVEQKKDLSELVPGERVSLDTSGGKVFGIVDKVDNGKLTVKDPRVITESGSMELDIEDINRINTLSDHVLKKVWPTLVFEPESKE